MWHQIPEHTEVAVGILSEQRLARVPAERRRRFRSSQQRKAIDASVIPAADLAEEVAAATILLKFFPMFYAATPPIWFPEHGQMAEYKPGMHVRTLVQQSQLWLYYTRHSSVFTPEEQDTFHHCLENMSEAAVILACWDGGFSSQRWASFNAYVKLDVS